MLRIIFLSFLVFSLSGCFEFIEDIQMKEDGSGTYKVTLNLSASKMKIKSVMALDSIRGREVPKQPDIQREIASLKNFFEVQKGISNVSSKIDFDDLIIRIQMDFDRLHQLEDAIISFVNHRMNEPSGLTKLFEFKNGQYHRYSMDHLFSGSWKQDIDSEDLEKLEEGSIVLITRFFHPIKSTNNELVSISKNKTAAMFRTSANKLLDKIDNHSYSIILEE